MKSNLSSLFLIAYVFSVVSSKQSYEDLPQYFLLKSYSFILHLDILSILSKFLQMMWGKNPFILVCGTIQLSHYHCWKEFLFTYWTVLVLVLEAIDHKYMSVSSYFSQPMFILPEPCTKLPTHTMSLALVCECVQVRFPCRSWTQATSTSVQLKAQKLALSSLILVSPFSLLILMNNWLAGICFDWLQMLSIYLSILYQSSIYLFNFYVYVWRWRWVLFFMCFFLHFDKKYIIFTNNP